MSAAEFPTRVEESIARIHAAMADRFDVSDLSVLIREAVEVAETLDDLKPTEKRALAIAFVCDLIDKFFTGQTPAIEKLIEDVDWPWLTDGMERTLVDPIVKRFAVPFAKDLLKLSIPYLVDLVVDATSGKVAVNQGEGE